MFKNFQHLLASLAQNIVRAAAIAKSGVVKLAAETPAIVNAVSAAEPTVEAVTSLLVPGAASIEQAAFHVFGEVAHALIAAGEAASANGLDVKLDAEAIAKVKAAIAALGGK